MTTADSRPEPPEPSSLLRVAAVQADIVWEDPTSNFERLGPWLDAAVAARARLVVLPEMFACGFSMNTGAVAEPPDGPTARFLQDRAEQLGLWIGGSFPELSPGGDDPRPTNTFLLAGPRGEVHRYRKVRPFTYGGEGDAYRAGDELVTVEVEGLRVTLFVCYDLRFADLFWATAPDTDAYLVVASWPRPRRSHWIRLLEARAIENQAYVVGVNRVGEDGIGGDNALTASGAPPLTYGGDSRIVDPAGEVLATASEGETLLLADLSAERVHQVRASFPFMGDRKGVPERWRRG